MRKEIKKDGNSHKIRLHAEDMRIYALDEGDLVDVQLEKVKEAKRR